jgi:hypothetical protein
MDPSENTVVHKTALLDCWFGEDGILYSRSKNAERSIKNYDELFVVYKKLSDDGKKKLCTLGDISKTEPLSKEVRDHISRELPKYIKAMALVSSSPMGKAIGNIFSLLASGPYPIASFTAKEEAAEWLRQHL